MITLVDNIVRPIAHRVGTATGAWLASQGIASGDVQVLVAAIPILVGVIVDLFIRRVI